MKFPALVLSLSLLGLVPTATFADTLTFTGVGGGSTDGIYVYPYDFTVTTPGGTVTNVQMSCLSFNHEISIGETWTVIQYSIPLGPGTLDGTTPNVDFRADDWLSHQYGNPLYTNSQVQFAIWSILDPADVHAGGNYDGFDATAQSLATQALIQADLQLPGYFANDVLYLPDLGNTSGWTNGVPQDFIGPPGCAPEPSSLILFGTGLLGTVAIMRRKLSLVQAAAAATAIDN